MDHLQHTHCIICVQHPTLHLLPSSSHSSVYPIELTCGEAKNFACQKQKCNHNAHHRFHCFLDGFALNSAPFPKSPFKSRMETSGPPSSAAAHDTNRIGHDVHSASPHSLPPLESTKKLVSADAPLRRADKSIPPPVAQTAGGSLSRCLGFNRHAPLLPVGLGRVASRMLSQSSTINETAPVGSMVGMNRNHLSRRQDELAEGGHSLSQSGHSASSPLRTVQPRRTQPLRRRLIQTMWKQGTTWDDLAGVYQRAVSGYSRISAEALRKWAEHEGEGEGDRSNAAERGPCEALAAAFLDDCNALPSLVAEFFQRPGVPSGEFVEFCRQAGIPLGDAAAWVNGGPSRGGASRVSRLLAPHALSLMCELAVSRRAAEQQARHEERKQSEIERRRRDTSKVVSPPDRLREMLHGDMPDQTAPAHSLLLLGVPSRSPSPVPIRYPASLKARFPHKFGMPKGADAAPDAIRLMDRHRSRFGGNSSSEDHSSFMKPLPGEAPVGPSNTVATTQLLIPFGPRPLPASTWRRMAPTVGGCIQGANSTPISPTRNPPGGAAPAQLTEASRPEWYQDRQELEAVMRRRILSANDKSETSELFDAFFERSPENRAIHRGGYYPVVGVVAERIVTERRDQQRAALYKRELGDAAW